MRSITIADIRVDGGTQSRAGIDLNVVGEYADAMAAGATFPPLVVFYDGADYWLADGFHRYQAYARAKVYDVPADVRQGSQRDAVLYSVGANNDHGLRRTNDDKRRAILTLLNDHEWSKWSDREIARHCKVDGKTVAGLRPKLTAEIRSDERTYTTKHGTQATMQTANIGRAPKPDQEAEAPARPALSLVVNEEPTAQFDETSSEVTAESDPDAAERRKLAKLPQDALIDDVIGLRADLEDAKTRIKKLEAENRELKQLNKDLNGDSAEVIRRQAQIIRHKESEMYRANDKAERAIRDAKRLERRVKELEKMGIAV